MAKADHKKTLSLHGIGKKAFGDGYKYWSYINRDATLSLEEKKAALKVHLEEKAKHTSFIINLRRTIKKYEK